MLIVKLKKNEVPDSVRDQNQEIQVHRTRQEVEVAQDLITPHQVDHQGLQLEEHNQALDRALQHHQQPNQQVKTSPHLVRGETRRMQTLYVTPYDNSDHQQHLKQVDLLQKKYRT